mmetsp:Transcript_35373/g.80360  ORF Transcript_35373/g.80360 Transcript_35373/m.80360 type:complete len:224 (-) Transcript_35373:78-749(-)
MMPSSGLPDFLEFFMSFLSPEMRSPRTVQQMQPLFISTMFSSSAMAPPFTSASSMPTSPNSFSMTAMRLPWFFSRMWFSKVVLPLPRKPVSTVTATLPSPPAGGAAPMPASSLARFLVGPSLLPSSEVAHSYSRTALFVAPSPARRSPRTSNMVRRVAFCSGAALAAAPSRKALGSFRICDSVPPSSVSMSSMQLLIFCTPSKCLPSASRASAWESSSLVDDI